MLTNLHYPREAQAAERMTPRTVLVPPTGRTLRPRRQTPAELAADRLHSAVVHLLRRLRRQDARLGIGPAGLSVLSVLVFGGPRSVSQLAEEEQVKLPTMSRLVRRLEGNDLVARAADLRDRRSTVVRATALGRRFMRWGREHRVADLAERLEQLTPEDVQVLDRAATLIEALAKRPS